MGHQNVQVAIVSGGLGGLSGLPADTRELTSPTSYTMTLTVLDHIAPLVLAFPINAESDARALPQTWADRGAMGTRTPKLDWQGNGAATVAIRALVQAPENLRLEADFLRPLELLRERINPTTQEPPLVIVTMGARQYRGSLTELNVERLRIDARGDALTAQVTMTITENAK